MKQLAVDCCFIFCGNVNLAKACAMIFDVFCSAKWLSIWRRLTPFWVGLWLLSLSGPATWQHFDGTICLTCTSNATAPVFDANCQKESKQHRTELEISAPDDCQKCCAPIPQNSRDDVVCFASHAAILGGRAIFTAPSERETRLYFARFALPLDALPRPPPRGRAPPFSIFDFTFLNS